MEDAKIEEIKKEEPKTLTFEERYENSLKSRMLIENELANMQKAYKELLDRNILIEGVLQTYELEYGFKREEVLKKIIAIEKLNKETNK